jgi:hypothetical protein
MPHPDPLSGVYTLGFLCTSLGGYINLYIRTSTIAHIYPSVLQALAGRGRAGRQEGVILGVSGCGYAGSWI